MRDLGIVGGHRGLALDGVDLRQIDNHNPGIPLGQNCVAHPESRLTVHHSPFALYERHVPKRAQDIC
jgi:hypothetical protein